MDDFWVSWIVELIGVEEPHPEFLLETNTHVEMIFANNIFTISFIETIGDNMSPSVQNKTSGKNELIFIAD